MATRGESGGPERRRIFGVPRSAEDEARRGVEQRRVLDVPVDWFGRVDTEWFASLAHPVRWWRRRSRRRRLGPYAPDDPGPERPH